MNAFRFGLMGASLCLVLSAPAQAFDLKSMTDSANKAVNDASDKANSSVNEANDAATGAMDSANSKLAVTGEAQALVDSLSTDLGVTQQQAAGGAGALLAMAQNNLSGDQFSGITSKVPGLDSLLGTIDRHCDAQSDGRIHTPPCRCSRRSVSLLITAQYPSTLDHPSLLLRRCCHVWLANRRGGLV